MIRCLLMTGILLFCATPSPAQTIPPRLNVQGVLRNVAGELATGQVSLTFRLFTEEYEGEKLWDETQTQTLSGGVFNVYLGPLPSNLFVGQGQTWLEVQVGTDEPLARRPLTSVGYAFVADRAREALTLSGPAADLSCGPVPCVSAVEVDFSWARGVTASGAAADLDCAGCVSSAEIADGSIGTADLGLGVVASPNLAADLSLAGNTQAANLLVTGNLYTGSAITADSLRLSKTGALMNITTLDLSGPLTSTVADGTPPFLVSSRTRVANLDADLLDGLDADHFANAGNLTAGTLAAARLPVATTSSRGAVIAGTGLAVDPDGTLRISGLLGLTASPPLVLAGSSNPVLSIPELLTWSSKVPDFSARSSPISVSNFCNTFQALQAVVP
jgi:hypothetical protein